MSSDQQDFLERQEARRRRMQQRQSQQPASGRSSRPAGESDEAASRQTGDRAQAAARGKSAAAKPPAPPSQARLSSTAAARKAGSAAPAETKRKADRLDAEKQPAPTRNSGGLEGRLLAERPEGRRAAARREELAGLPPLPQEPRPSLLARLILWGTAAICGLLILATIGEAWTVHRLNQQVAANQQAADQLQAQNQALANTIQQLQQPSTIEAEARKLGFIFPGDQPVVIVTTTPAPASPKQTAPPSSDWFGFWTDWLKLFFGG
ncbi:MAG TPA: septum formation initiator family protein [Ktedonobacterales bacterium]|jgi:cell division protein FtsB